MSEAPSPLELLFGGRPAQRSSPTRPLMETQRLELLGRFQAYQNDFDFVPGTLVVEKDGLGVLNNEARKTTALMFWRKLDQEDASEGYLIKDLVANPKGFDRLDCLVAYISDDGAATIFVPSCSRSLRPLTAEELSALDNVTIKGASSAEEAAA